jgi:hypothetical protein
MIDLTSLQLQAIPPSITSLQATNGLLQKKNDDLTKIILIAGVVAAGFIIYKYYVKFSDHKREVELKFKNKEML